MSFLLEGRRVSVIVSGKRVEELPEDLAKIDNQQALLRYIMHHQFLLVNQDSKLKVLNNSVFTSLNKRDVRYRALIGVVVLDKGETVTIDGKEVTKFDLSITANPIRWQDATIFEEIADSLSDTGSITTEGKVWTKKELLKEAVNFGGRSSKLYTSLARCLNDSEKANIRGIWCSSKELFIRAMARDPNNAEPVAHLGMRLKAGETVLIANRNWSKKGLLIKALNMNPDCHKVLADLSMLVEVGKPVVIGGKEYSKQELAIRALETNKNSLEAFISLINTMDNGDRVTVSGISSSKRSVVIQALESHPYYSWLWYALLLTLEENEEVLVDDRRLSTSEVAKQAFIRHHSYRKDKEQAIDSKIASILQKKEKEKNKRCSKEEFPAEVREAAMQVLQSLSDGLQRAKEALFNEYVHHLYQRKEYDLSKDFDRKADSLFVLYKQEMDGIFDTFYKKRERRHLEKEKRAVLDEFLALETRIVKEEEKNVAFLKERFSHARAQIEQTTVLGRAPQILKSFSFGVKDKDALLAKVQSELQERAKELKDLCHENQKLQREVARLEEELTRSPLSPVEKKESPRKEESDPYRSNSREKLYQIALDKLNHLDQMVALRKLLNDRVEKESEIAKGLRIMGFEEKASNGGGSHVIFTPKDPCLKEKIGALILSSHDDRADPSLVADFYRAACITLDQWNQVP
jgi:hypothetical protein